MSDLRRPGLLVLWLLLAGCQAGLPQARARLDHEGAVYVYLEPLTPEAERLRVSLAGISARHRDGGKLPLALALRELRGQELGRQRLLAAGPLPAGEYSGLVFRTAKASLRGQEGEAALLVPEASATTDFTFTVRRGEGSVISLALKYAESVDAGFSFRPAFAAHLPERPPVALMGFVANSRSNDVTVFEKKSMRVFDVIATGAEPSGMALDQRAGKVYVALSRDDAVEVVDVTADRITDRVRLTPGDGPVALALTPDGRTLLSANRGSNTVSVIDPVSRFELMKIRVGNGPRAVLIDRAGRLAFVLNGLSSTVSVIDLLNRVVIRSIPTDPGPVQGHLNRRGDRLYVIHDIASYVTVINATTLAVTGRFPLRAAMDAIKVDPSTDLVYLGGRRELTVGVYDPFSFMAVDVVDTGMDTVTMAVDGQENALYLVSSGSNRVLVFDRIRKRMVGELDVGDGPNWISVMGEN